MVRTDVILGAEASLDLYEEWAALYARASGARVYQSHAWGRGWLRHAAANQEHVLTVCVRRNERLCAIFPIVRGSIGPVSCWSPLGTGEPGALMPLVDPRDAEAIEALVDATAQAIGRLPLVGHDWDRDHPASRAWLDTCASRDWNVCRFPRTVCKTVRLCPTFDEYLAQTMSRKARHNIRWATRRLAARTPVTMHRLEGASLTPQVWERVARIQQASWLYRRGVKSLAADVYPALLDELSRAGLIDVWLVTLADQDAAFAVCLRQPERLTLQWMGFDERFESLGVGRVLLTTIISDACARGFTLFDFVHGDADYKRHWSTGEEHIDRIVLGSPNPVAFGWHAMRMGLALSQYPLARALARGRLRP